MEKRVWVCVFALLLAVIVMPASIFAGSAGKEKPGAKSSELLLFEEIPMVVTPGKKLQPITEAPASVYVVTQEDIKQSGSIHLWDALRGVPGLDVNTVTEGQAEISMRGFGDITTNKTLIMIDGRSIYNPMQGIQLLQLLTVQPEEIDRIEVVKGPVASLYGANANLGLINIITKAPGQVKGGVFSATGGAKDAGLYSFLYGDTHGDLSYKLSGGWEQEDAFKPRNDNLTKAGRWNTELKYKIDDESDLSFSGGMNRSVFNFVSNTSQIENLWYYGPDVYRNYYLQSVYQNGGLKTRLYWIREHSSYDAAKQHTWTNTDTIDEETSYTFDLGDKHSLIAGGGGRFYLAKGNLFTNDNEKHSQALWDLYLQDEYKMLEKLALVGSARVDRYPLNGYNTSLRLAAVYTHDKNSVFRTSVGSSFRAPTITDLYYCGSISPIDAFPAWTQTTRGNEDLDPEKYLTVEAGYQGTYLNHKLRPFADIFWTKITDFIETYSTGGGPLGLDVSFKNNSGEAYSSGAEMGAEYDVARQLTLIANYAFNNLRYDDTGSRYFSPRHKANAGFQWKGLNDKLSVRLLSHYVQRATSNISGGGAIKSYFMGNLWVGYRINDALEVSMSGYNIFNDVHIESPNGDKIGTRMLGSVRVKF